MFAWWMPSKSASLDNIKWNHPNTLVFQRDDTKVINLTWQILPFTAPTAIGPCIALVMSSQWIHGFYVDASKLPTPLHYVVNAVVIVFRRSYERTLFKEIALEKVLPLCSACCRGMGFDWAD